MEKSLYLMCKLNKNQSLMYQIMIILMEEHKKARLGKSHIGFHDGGDLLVFDKKTWDKEVRNKIKKYISINYRENFKEMSLDYIIGLFPEENSLCKLRKIEKSTIEDREDDFNDEEMRIKKDKKDEEEVQYVEFKITNSGYSYQYNGYKRATDKLQKKANSFLLMTLIYYILSWAFNSSSDLFKTIFDVCSSMKIFLCLNVNEIIRTALIVVVILIIYETIKKLNER